MRQCSFAALFDTIEKEIGSVYLDSPDVIAERFGTRFKTVKHKAYKGNGHKGESAGKGRKIHKDNI